MMVASFGAGGSVNLAPLNQIQAGDSVGGHSQVKDVVGNSSLSSGDGVKVTTTDVLSDGTIRDLMLLYLLDDDKGGKGDKSAALLLGSQLYQAAQTLQNMQGGGGMGGTSGVNI